MSRGFAFPGSDKNERLTWNRYRDQMCDHLVKTQNADGSWTSGHIGTIFTTAVNMTILQLDKGTLPFYQR